MNKKTVLMFALITAFAIGMIASFDWVEAVQPPGKGKQSPTLDVLIVTGSEVSAGISTVTSTADCPSTHTLVGGGFAKMRDKDYSTSGERIWTSSQLDSDTCQVTAKGDSGITTSVQAQAFCVKLSP